MGGILKVRLLFWRSDLSGGGDADVRSSFVELGSMSDLRATSLSSPMF